MKCLRFLASIAAILFCGLCVPSAGAQSFHRFSQGDIAFGLAGEYTPSITSQSNLTHQATTDSIGFLVSFRDHPVSWAGVELNYQYARLSERFVRQNQSSVNVPLDFHEGTAAYLFQIHRGRVRPFIAVGGGALYFDPEPVHVHTQIRAAGLFNVGTDIPISQHLSLRLQGRSLYYRAPNFNDPSISSSRWVATVQPTASYVIRW